MSISRENSIDSNPNDVANRAINSINFLLQAANIEAENEQLKLDLHLVKVRLNTISLQRESLQSQLDACRKRDCSGDGIHSVKDLPAVLAGDLIVTENGGVQDPVSGMVIDP